ncbi:MAG: DUF1573 domain-containing protein [Deltaproteobacteria bacterium]|nr:DUF1573 domain-containing protein [Deltaproteobacteria bacterium]MBW1737088.1 DUF1573 domain-containing protein [Deltaproteobacteria bacterium]MBW1909359.1 DUF1573 domain-containing protein [Deltaproteobacteria bacterium]MBW2033047.1 DUF1573 domain-containing protein [Deltaproteobacteria bacterium]MBW2114022.1 DUF1573 domain-containing protein [Deltaproteobacteria bacterium]
MTKNILKSFLLLLFLSITLLWRSQVYPAQSGNGPIIHFDQTNHIFPTVFEGEKLSHTFTVFNQGTANLDIKRVTSS